MTMAPSRISYIDNLKALAILLVVMGHITEYAFMTVDSVFNAFYSSFHMPLFMFLSGCFALKNISRWDSSETWHYVKSKFLRVMVPFFVVGGCYSLLFRHDFFGIVTGVTLEYWFFPALFASMIFEIIVAHVEHRINTSRKALVDVSIHAAAYLALGYLYSRTAFGAVPYALHFLKMYPFFYFGILYTKYQKVQGSIKESNITFALCLLAYVAIFIFALHRQLPFLVHAFFAIAVLERLALATAAKTPGWFTTIGKYSMEIYCFHWFLVSPQYGSFIPTWLQGMVVSNIAVMVLAALLLSVPVIALSIGAAQIVKKNSVLRLLCFGQR